MNSEEKKTAILIGSRLYKARTELGLKQSELECEGIISQSSLSKFENAQLSISAYMLHKLALRYGKGLDYFFSK